jgi:hypothetical protein
MLAENVTPLVGVKWVSKHWMHPGTFFYIYKKYYLYTNCYSMFLIQTIKTNILPFLAGTDDGIPLKLQEIQIDVIDVEECKSLMPRNGSDRIREGPHICIYDYRDVPQEEKRGICSVCVNSN